MNRRVFIKNIAIVSFFTGIQLSGCTHFKYEWDSIENFVYRIRPSILPSGKNIDIDAMKLEQFVLVMLRDCFSPEEQNKFFSGILELDKYCEERYKTVFLKLTDSELNQLVIALNEKSKDFKEDTLFLFSKVKTKIIQGFQQSEFMMKERQTYELVPGRYNGQYKIS